MKKHFDASLFIAILLIFFGNSNCALSQTKSPTAVDGKAAGDNQNGVISAKHNTKYNLTVTFHQDKIESAFYFFHSQLRNDETGAEIRLADYGGTKEATLPESVQQSWSADEEFLLVKYQIYGGFKIYKSSELAGGKDLKSSKPLDEINVVTDKGNNEYVHDFVRWEGATSFVFTATRFKYVNNEKVLDEPVEYNYEMTNKKLRCLAKSSKARCGSIRRQESGIRLIRRAD